MEPQEITAQSASRLDPATLTGLARFRFTAPQLTALAGQGFVSCEYRGARGPYFKLRFRFGGRQIVRCLGKDPQWVAAIRQELADLQRERHLKRTLQRLTHEARQALRASKRALMPLVIARGFHFHGHALRKRR